MASRKTASTRKRLPKNTSARKNASSLVKRLKRTLARTKKAAKKRVKSNKKVGGGVGMPIEYFGGESSVWTDNALASVSTPLTEGYTWNDFSSVTPQS